ncbi:SWIM zinc finger family protein [Methanolobus psychrotolerans]|uniref:SWIM zinc finger family protein n=1 Tax=Methanolobus psychrotolerans TaxID=1874706 RepID=UPI000B91C90D|nr:SWIM zinc finger family protein [Methanolobus psychrotolerans]
MSWSNDSWRGYSPSKPIKTDGGIKTRSKRGSIGDTWWSKRWVKVLESFGWSNRLERGRRYARSGQVLSLKFIPGKVTAKVQGSAKNPYSVSIEIEPLNEKEWDRVANEMSQKAIFAAKLLAGEMPQNIEEAFDEVGAALFPTSDKDIHTSCSCPDFANPCKHIAAVYYLLAEKFDKDPFMLFELRGRSKDDIIAILRKKRRCSDENTSELEVLPDVSSDKKNKHEEKFLPIDDFWSGKDTGSFSVDISLPEIDASIIKRLGIPGFWDLKEDFIEIMTDNYKEISRHAIEMAYWNPNDKTKQQNISSGRNLK